MEQDVDDILDAVEAACRSAASVYGADDVERGEDAVRFQGEDGAVDWEARARVVPRTTGEREEEEGRLRGSEIGENRIESGEYTVRVEVTAAYDREGEHIVDRYARNGVKPDIESVEDELKRAHKRLPSP